MTKDPFPGFYNQPITLHPYLYGLDNPIRYTDPTGENPLIAVCLAFAIIADPVTPAGEMLCLTLWATGALGAGLLAGWAAPQIGEAFGEATEEVIDICTITWEYLLERVRPEPDPFPDEIFPPVPIPQPDRDEDPDNRVVVRFINKFDYDWVQSKTLHVFEFQSYATTSMRLLQEEAIAPGTLNNPTAIANNILFNKPERAEYFVAFYRRGLDEYPGVKIRGDSPTEVWWLFPRFKPNGEEFGSPSEFLDMSGYYIDSGKTTEKMSVLYLQWLLTLE